MRITGGLHRSRILRAPRGKLTRPTSDRVREALFGILAAAGAIEGARVLDLYAGTGALALEALSRGAADATLVESSGAALGVLRANVGALGLGARARVLELDVERAAARIAGAGPFDIVLADPPWAHVDSGAAERALAHIVSAGALKAGGWFVLEHSSRSPPPAVALLERLETRVYGDTALTFYKPAILAVPTA
jgi:16S rRNA (guanine966-N2)-methyltransferase